MSKPEFDRYADQYDRVLSEAIPECLNEDSYFTQYKIALMAARMSGSRSRRILDFGCSVGRSLPYLDQYFPEAELWGYDVSPASLKVAAERAPRAKLFSEWKAIAGLRFDAIIAANVFHHIPPAQREDTLARCYESLAADGQMFLFEHNPFNPVTRLIFDRCQFDKDAEMLSLKAVLNLTAKTGFRYKQYGYTLFFPRQLAFLRRLEPWLIRLPLGAQYFVQAVK